MKKIRFRLYTGTKMIYDQFAILDCLKQQIAFEEKVMTHIGYDHIGIHGFKFQQLTPFIDINKKGIWQGDIIQSFFSDGKPSRHVVVWDNDCGSFRAQFIPFNKHFPDCHICKSWIDECKKEVVGNIYENRELLK